ncbi:MAG TPA: type II toxin-antitoxin system antitoxin SocA domain-containing protein [Actinomycetota bacterium]|nr:type II toxin-antitoxin system antitoxin SocA domain-containing protein [Actinomycetota bacterium]
MSEPGRAPIAELVLLAAGDLSASPGYGATKLNKALFFSDLLHYKRHGTPISGAVYDRLPRGPAPRGILAVRRGLVEAGDATLHQVGYLGYVQTRLVPLRAPAPGVIGSTALQMVHEVCAALAGHSHANVLGWQLAAEREEIPYHSIFLSSAVPARADLQRGAAVAAERGLTGAPRRPAGAGSSPDAGVGPGERTLRSVSYECATSELRASYPRAGDVFAGIEWALARWPDGVHRVPGTRLSVVRTEWPAPSLRVYFTLPGEGRCTVWAIDEVPPYAEEEDGSD